MMKNVKLCVLTLVAMSGCSQTNYVSDDAVGTAELPKYYSVSTSQSAEQSLDCVLREVALSNSNNTFEHRYTSEGWVVDVVYGKNGVVGGMQIGRIAKSVDMMDFYYRPSLGNFGMDAWNVEAVIPDALTRCA